MHLRSLFALSFLLFVSCTESNTHADTATPAVKAYLEITTSFQHLLDSAGLRGSILLFDDKAGIYYSNNFEWARTGQLPASTFKIPNSIIALETGVIPDEKTILTWDGTTRSIQNWNQDLTFKDAFAYSCVPCYQRIAREIGNDRMRENLDRLQYPKTVQFDTSNIDMFWLVGDARISQFEQIDFIRKLHEEKLPISNGTAEIMRKIMVIDTTEKYILSGKTGWSNDHGNDNGWFVGYAKADKKTLYFATNIEPKSETEITAFISGRQTITQAAIDLIDW